MDLDEEDSGCGGRQSCQSSELWALINADGRLMNGSVACRPSAPVTCTPTASTYRTADEYCCARCTPDGRKKSLCPSDCQSVADKLPATTISPSFTTCRASARFNCSDRQRLH